MAFGVEILWMMRAKAVENPTVKIYFGGDRARTRPGAPVDASFARRFA